MAKKNLPKIPNEEVDKIVSLGSTTATENETDEDESISTIQREKEPAPTKQKRKISERQLKALHEGQEKLLRMTREKRELEKQQEEEDRKRREELIIKKALALKKKKIREEAILNNIRDDETPIEVIKTIAKKTNTKTKETLPPIPIPQKPKFIFV